MTLPRKFGATLLAAAMLGAAGLLLGGCQTHDQQNIQLIADLQTCRDENAKLKKDNSDLEQTRIEQAKRILTLEGLGEKRLELLFTPTSIQIGPHSGAINESGAPGDEGVRVYIKPIDRDGSVVKAAGSVKIELFDLARAAMIGCYDFPASDIAKHWESGFLTYHYRFDCPWQNQPTNPDVTIRATFVDYLTGATLTDQKVVRVKLPPASQPASSQAASQPASPTTSPASPCSTTAMSGPTSKP